MPDQDARFPRTPWIRPATRRVIRTLSHTALLLGGLALGAQAAAHQLWLEPKDGALGMYYGYMDRNHREVSPGRLDEIVAPKAMIVVEGIGPQTVDTAMQRSHLALDAKPEHTALLIHDNGPVYRNEQGGETVAMHWTMTSRFAPNLDTVEPVLEFDVTPTGETGAFLVTLYGNPVGPRHAVRLSHEGGWSMERRTDEHGIVRFPGLPWQGLYMVSARHTVAEPGRRERTLEDGSTETIEHSHRGFATNLTFIRSQGLDPLPRLPASGPHEEGMRAGAEGN
ncbi:MAG: hypothetical protein JJT90_08055 [Ectothiorhodospiraceae bacterium]|nr:hypothetical protein [Ectothiorhodospiraceae bacterium]